jgi:hypothetical protein
MIYFLLPNFRYHHLTIFIEGFGYSGLSNNQFNSSNLMNLKQRKVIDEQQVFFDGWL